jgi:hypothetical protein
MAIAMFVNHDPNASGANVISMTALGLVLAALAIFLYRALFRPDQDAPLTPRGVGR